MDPVCSFSYKIAINGKKIKEICTDKAILSAATAKMDFVCNGPGGYIPGRADLMFDFKVWRDQKYLSKFIESQIVPLCGQGKTISLIK